jgi:hypothetical protein
LTKSAKLGIPDFVRLGSQITITMEKDGTQKNNEELIVTGKHLLEMNVHTMGDTRNFLIGVNNVASQLSLNTGLLTALESASASSHKASAILSSIEASNLASSTIARLYMGTAQTLELSKSVTTVLAYGQAAQNRFSAIVGPSVALNSIVTISEDTLIRLGGLSSRPHLYTSPEPITSPFIFSPQEIKTEEITKKLPEVQKGLPAKITEAIEMLEYFQKPDIEKGDQKITTTLNEVKRAMENILGFNAIFIQQKTTTEIAITSIPELQVRNVVGDTTPLAPSPIHQKTSLVQDLVIGPLVYRKDGCILYKQTSIKMRYQMRTLCILFMNNHKNLVDYSTIKDELVPAEKRSRTSFETITKYVSELHNLLKKHFNHEVIFNQEKDGYIFDIEQGS